METRLAIIGIIVEEKESVAKVNGLLSEYGEFIRGRMGLPYGELGVITVVIDAPMDAISALSGKLGALSGISTKTIYSKK